MNTIEKIKNNKAPIIIFGAGVVGEALYYACREAGIKVECFCDNNINKTKSSKRKTEVIHVPALKKKYQDAVFLISSADIKDVVEQLKGLGYSEWHAGSLLLKDFDIYQNKFNAPMEFVEYAVATVILCHDSYLTPNKLFLRSVDIIITECCSLKCRDCSNLTQYYKNPANCDIDELTRAIDKFCVIIDEVNEFRVIGGEPFMNKDAHLIIKRLVDEPKAKKIVIYTNGTIIPREDQIKYLKDKKVLFIITDYGKLSINLNKLIEVLKCHNIDYYVVKARGWTDCAKIGKHHRKIGQRKEIFKNCCAKNTITLSKGNLYRCPFHANADRLRAVPDISGDYVNIFDKTAGLDETKKKIRKYLLEKDFLKVCDYCNGRSFGDTEITPAIQISKPLEYKHYSK
ncbi:radical SAM protein [Patescibacteria group bacterium]|nr:radical SAM protein [Patescibacteria group bacterium]